MKHTLLINLSSQAKATVDATEKARIIGDLRTKVRLVSCQIRLKSRWRREIVEQYTTMGLFSYQIKLASRWPKNSTALFEGASCKTIFYFQVCGLKSERTVCCEDGSPSGAFLNSPSVVDPKILLFSWNFTQYFKSKTRVMYNIDSWIESRISWQWNLFSGKSISSSATTGVTAKLAFQTYFI